MADPIITVGQVADLYGVSSPTVRQWLRDKRIHATRTPCASWRIPAAQFEQDRRHATSRAELDDLRRHLGRVHDGDRLPSEAELAAAMRRDDER